MLQLAKMQTAKLRSLLIQEFFFSGRRRRRSRIRRAAMKAFALDDDPCVHQRAAIAIGVKALALVGVIEFTH